jgi:hypothetical protein
VYIEGMRHEGIAASNGAKVIVRDSVVRGCAQGIEAGWGAPEVHVERCTLVGNGVGLRWGDEYPWQTSGSLRASGVIVRDSGQAAALSHWEGGQQENPSALLVTCSALDRAGWVGTGNAGNPPQIDGRGCPLGGPRVNDGCTVALGPSTCDQSARVITSAYTR